MMDYRFASAHHWFGETDGHIGQVVRRIVEVGERRAWINRARHSGRTEGLSQTRRPWNALLVVY